MADCWQPEAAFQGPQWMQNNQTCVRPSTFRDLMYAFPKPRQTGRITKPRSAGNSPSSAGRRRTSTMPYSSPMYQQLSAQEYQTALNAALLASTLERGRRARPISWHPVSREPEYITPQYYPPCTTTTHGLPVMQICPSQQLQTTPPPCSNEGMMQAFVPSEIHMPQQAFPITTTQPQLPMQDMSFLQVDNSQAEGVSWEGPASGFPAFVQPTSEDWAFDMMSMHQSIPSVGAPGSHYESVSSSGHLTEPSTPDFLPIQQFGDASDSQSVPVLGKQKHEDELVGMGLYTDPDTFLEGSLNGLNGKGLKLEETFTPSSDDEGDDNDAEGDQDEPNEMHAPQKQPTKPAESMMHKSFFFDDGDDFQQRSIAESRHSFNIGATCMNYGYGWV